MQLLPNTVHVWSIHLPSTIIELADGETYLSEEEKYRAAQFRFAVHRERFLGARFALRYILSLYLNVAPESIQFNKSSHGKPYIESPKTNVQFNISHADEFAVFAITLDHAIGVDIEKMRDRASQDIAARFFTYEENAALKRAPRDAKLATFYRLWSRKEAIIKALGKGISSLPLSSFSVSATDNPEIVFMGNELWLLRSLTIHADYQTALACVASAKTIHYFYLANGEPVLDRISQR